MDACTYVYSSKFKKKKKEKGDAIKRDRELLSSRLGQEEGYKSQDGARFGTKPVKYWRNLTGIFK